MLHFERSRILLVLLIAILLSSAQCVRAQGTGKEKLTAKEDKNRGETATPGHELSTRHATFVTKMVSFRTKATQISMKETGYPGDKEKRLDFLYKGDYAEHASLAWSLFFSGSLIVPGLLDSKQPVTAFYNPWLDMALILEWTSADEAMPMVKNVTLWSSGADFAAGKHQGELPPRWFENLRKEALPLVIQKQVMQFSEAFHRQYPILQRKPGVLVLNSRQDEARDIGVRRAGDALRRIYDGTTKGTPQYNPLIGDVHRALRTKNWSAVMANMKPGTGFKPEELNRLPDELRASLTPSQILADKQAAIGLWISSRVPTQFLAVRFTNAPEQRIESIHFINLEVE